MNATVDDRRPDPEPDTPSPADRGVHAEALDAPPGARPDRREFMRHLSRDAVWTAGRLARFSSIVRRSVMAAGEGATRDLESTHEALPPGPAPAPAPAPAVPLDADASPVTAWVRDPVLTLTPAQHEFLGNGSKATLAVNDPAGSPHQTASMYHWDGDAIRLPAGMFTARTMLVDRDPRVSLLVEDPASDAWLALTGVASLAYGPQVEVEMMTLLSKYLDAEAAARRWEEMRSSGDQAVILVRPTRIVWRPA